jgi:hypothetical protein
VGVLNPEDQVISWEDLSAAVARVMIRRDPAAVAAATVPHDGQVSIPGRAWNRPREPTLVEVLPGEPG